MDSTLNAAALALATGDVLGALNRVALRDDAAALALRGTAMAQLGDLEAARVLLRRAARGFGRQEELSRARCVLAEAEIALVSRDLLWPDNWFEGARATLARRGDKGNAACADIIAARRYLLLGRLEAAEASVAAIDVAALSPALQATCHLVVAGIAVRRLDIARAEGAVDLASSAAHKSMLRGLIVEVDSIRQTLGEPAAMLRQGGTERAVLLAEIADLLTSDVLVADATQNALRRGSVVIPMATRPVLFAILRLLAEAWPGDASREDLLHAAFRARHADESHRARLRVEITRLRQLVAPLADIAATPGGFRLHSLGGEVAVLSLPLSGQDAAVMALLADGELWSSSALALVLGTSARTIQRALTELQRKGKVQAIGRGRAQRWNLVALPGFPTTLLLPSGS